MLKAFVRVQAAAARLQTRERGATAVEYGLMIALIAAVIVGVVLGLGKNLSNIFTNVNSAV